MPYFQEHQTKRPGISVSPRKLLLMLCTCTQRRNVHIVNKPLYFIHCSLQKILKKKKTRNLQKILWWDSEDGSLHWTRSWLNSNTTDIPAAGGRDAVIRSLLECALSAKRWVHRIRHSVSFSTRHCIVFSTMLTLFQLNKTGGS